MKRSYHFLTPEERKKDKILGAEARTLRLQLGIEFLRAAKRMKCSGGFLRDLELGQRHWSDKWINRFERMIK